MFLDFSYAFISHVNIIPLNLENLNLKANFKTTVHCLHLYRQVFLWKKKSIIDYILRINCWIFFLENITIFMYCTNIVNTYFLNVKTIMLKLRRNCRFIEIFRMKRSYRTGVTLEKFITHSQYKMLYIPRYSEDVTYR